MAAKEPLPVSVYQQPSVEFAQYLIGCIMQVGRCSGRIVETEAYTGPPEDYASHAYTRANSAAEIMQTAGRVYVYAIHAGVATNITCNDGEAGAVLLRAIEPLTGIERMIHRRSRKNTKVSQTWNINDYQSLTTLTNGPSKLSEALGILIAWNNSAVGEHVALFRRKGQPQIVSSRRIGISSSEDLEWRFCDPQSAFLSRTVR
ncbi:MAG TPA: DNA-3-methyladenine glycosylase [bacterium]|nr:DNA-3-methyladenine glycosylase [bacterium]